MTWTLRRILIAIVILSALAVAGTLYWVTATYQRFAIATQQQTTASTVSHLVRRRIEDLHRRKVNPFIDEWSRLSTLVQGMREENPDKARIAANRMMLTLEVAEGRVQLRNVVIYSQEMEVVATADKGTSESLSVLPNLVGDLRKRNQHDQRQIASFLWRGSDGRPLYSTIAPIGGFQVAGFVEFVSDPIPDLEGVGEAVQGQFRLVDINGEILFDGDAPAAAEGAKFDTLSVPITDALGDTWAIAMVTRDITAFESSVSRLRNQALAIVAVVILGSVLVGWLMLRFAVFRRLREFSAAMGMLAQGSTDVSMPVVGPDEFRDMRTSLGLLKDAVAQREAATDALRESEERLKAIIDNSPNAIYLKDTEGRYTLVNASTARDQGFDLQGMIGKTAFDHLPRQIAEQIAAQEAEVLKTGKVSERELEITTKDRGPRVGLMVKFPVFDASGVMTAVGTITIDITERKHSEEALLAARERAEQQANLQRIILDNVGQGILVYHEDSRALLWNDLATQFTGLTDAALSEHATVETYDKFQFESFDFSEETKHLAAEFERRRKAGERDFVVTYQRRGIDGDSWVQVSLRSLADGRVVQTYQDITDLRRAIDAAQQAQRLAEDANRAKSDFLSNMSHELRTPLNAIIGFTEFVLENDDEPITEEQHASLSQVLKAGRHLLVLINDVLDLSRIEAGAISLSIEPVDAGQVIDECVSLTSSFAAGKNVEVTNPLVSEDLPPIEADRIRFKQVFLNLLSNAIKYNRDPGTVFIETGSTEPGMLRIGVRDSGPGLPEDRLAKLFDPFDRLGAENSAIEGTGIGLTITKSLVDQMGGKISVDSVVGEGATFWLDMRVSERAAEDRIEAEHLGDQRPHVSGLVLYVEDNPANLELVRKILTLQPGIDFIGAPTGEIGIERARAERPDVILLDINLPGLNGFQVLEVLGAMPETRHIPIIALTAAATPDDIKRGQAAGFFSYLTKPIAARLLMAAIRRALQPAEPSDDEGEPTLKPSGKVLVVDDVAINLAITQRQLAKLGIGCDVEEDPVRALDKLKTGDYALALIDIGMPVMNGIELTKRLREAEQATGIHTPVIALTANVGSEEDIARFRKAGMDGQLTKPVVLKELAATLYRWFSRHGEERAPSAPLLAPHHESSDHAPPVDLDEFKEILGTDDTDMIRDMFNLFIEMVPAELENLSDALAARDKVQSREAAHRFKSSAKNAAAGRLSDLLQKIETEAQAGDWDTLDHDLELIQRECIKVTEYMRAGV